MAPTIASQIHFLFEPAVLALIGRFGGQGFGFGKGAGTFFDGDPAAQGPGRATQITTDLAEAHHPDDIIAGVLSSQGRRTATGERSTAGRVGNLRRHWKIPCYQPSATPPEGERLSIGAAARQLGLAPSTLLRWLNDGFIAGEQVTPGAPWRIRMTQDLRSLVVDQSPVGYVTMFQAMQILGVSRQTIVQRVKRGELSVVRVTRGRQKGLRIRVLDNQPQLFPADA